MGGHGSVAATVVSARAVRVNVSPLATPMRRAPKSNARMICGRDCGALGRSFTRGLRAG
jgi:hypothetical protein